MELLGEIRKSVLCVASMLLPSWEVGFFGIEEDMAVCVCVCVCFYVLMSLAVDTGRGNMQSVQENLWSGKTLFVTPFPLLLI